MGACYDKPCVSNPECYDRFGRQLCRCVNEAGRHECQRGEFPLFFLHSTSVIWKGSVMTGANST